MSKSTTKSKRFSWKTAALKLARCVVTTIKTDGKIGMGSGLVMHRDAAGKTHVERWDKDFIKALAYIGVEVVEKPKAPKRNAKPKRSQ
jgi:hypothetical protein